jgi:hypothetical protein
MPLINGHRSARNPPSCQNWQLKERNEMGRRLALALPVLAVKVALLGTALAAAEAFWAKVRIFRVPELQAGPSCSRGSQWGPCSS